MAIASPPSKTPINEVDVANPQGQKPIFMARAWVRFFSNLVQTVDLKPQRLVKELLTGQGTSLATTPLPTAILNAGLYRVSYYARVTRAASVSSSLQVTLLWTDGGVAQTESGSVITGNSTTTTQSGSLLVRSDGSSPISYSTTYASSGGTSMLYSLSVVVELIAPETV